MKLFECTKCGHIEFNQAPQKCLVCHSDGQSFKENPACIQKPGQPGKVEADNKHLPKILIVKECGLLPNTGCVDVHVKVGEVEHPMMENHYIRYIDYYHDYKFISRIWLSPEACHPAGALHLKANSGTLTAIENCNLHGNWMSEAKI